MKLRLTVLSLLVVTVGFVDAPPASASAVPAITVTSHTVTGNSGSNTYTETVPTIVVSNAGTAQASVNAAVQTFIQGIVTDFMTTVQNIPSDGSSSPATSTLSVNVTGTYATNTVISMIATAFTSLAGGAHPDSRVYSLNFDLNADKVVSLTDLVSAQALPQLANLLSTLLPTAYAAHGSGSGCAADIPSVLSNLQDTSSYAPAVALSAAGLVVSLQEYALGPYGDSCDVSVSVPYALLGGILQSDYAPTKPPTTGPTAHEPSPDQCVARSVSDQVSASVTAFSLELGGTDTTEIAKTAASDNPYEVDLNGQARFGVHLIFGASGEDSSETAAQGLGVSGDIGAGLQFDGSLGYSDLAESDAQALAQPIQSGADISSDQSLQATLNRPSSFSVDAGVWLNGGVDLSTPDGPHGSIDGELAVALGYGEDLDQTGQPIDQQIYFAASADLNATGDTSTLLGPAALSGNFGLSSDSKLALSTDPSGNPTGLSTEIAAQETSGAGSSAGITLPKAYKGLTSDLQGSDSVSTGSDVEYSTDVSTKGNPQLTSDLNELAQAFLSDNGVPPSSETTSSVLSQLAAAAETKLLTYRVTLTTGGAELQGGELEGWGVQSGVTVVDKVLTGALFAPAGSSNLLAWTTCQDAGQQEMASGSL
jgi:hypothetical protein